MNALRILVSIAAAIPALGWLAGPWSETGDALGSLLSGGMVLAVLGLLPIGGRPRWWQVAVCVATLSVGAAAIAPELVAHRAVARRGGERLVVVTHNVAVANVDPAATAAALIAADADVLLLQEVNGAFAPMLPRLRARYRWGSTCERQCSLAILARLPLDRVRYRFRDAGGKAVGPPLVQTVLHPPGRAPVPLVTVHLPWPLPAGRQRAQRDALAQVLATRSASRTILAGDCNSVAWSRAMRRLDAQLAPLARATMMLPTFPARWHGVATVPMLPIDHLFVGPDWQIESVERLGRTGSDHFGVRIVLVGRQAGNAANAVAGQHGLGGE